MSRTNYSTWDNAEVLMDDKSLIECLKVELAESDPLILLKAARNVARARGFAPYELPDDSPGLSASLEGEIRQINARSVYIQASFSRATRSKVVSFDGWTDDPDFPKEARRVKMQGGLFADANIIWRTLTVITFPHSLSPDCTGPNCRMRIM